MAYKSKSIEEYLQRRIKTLRAEGKSDFEIVQQLEAVVGRKAVVAEIARQKLTA
jgi:hypothetical protein